MNAGQIKLLKLLFALISTHLVLYPASAISKELTARDSVIMGLAIGRCLFYEGYLTRENAVKASINALKEEGISIERVMTIMEDKDIQESIDNSIENAGGCKKIGKDFDGWLQKYR